MLVLLLILHIIRSKNEIRRTLNDRLVSDIQVNSGVFQISASKLRASNRDFTVGAIPDKDRLFCWPDEELSVGASIDGNLKVKK
jgi:hypothetical protein